MSTNSLSEHMIPSFSKVYDSAFKAQKFVIDVSISYDEYCFSNIFKTSIGMDFNDHYCLCILQNMYNGCFDFS